MIVVTQINLLLSLFNDVIDFKLIKTGQLQLKMQTFSPSEVFQFLIKLFATPAKMRASQIEFVKDSHLADTKCNDLLIGKKDKHTPLKCGGKVAHLPDYLCGDQIHLKQILICLIKCALNHSYNGKICIKAAFDQDSEML